MSTLPDDRPSKRAGSTGPGAPTETEGQADDVAPATLPCSTAPAPHGVDAALEAARALGLARLDAQLLLSHVMQRPRVWVIAHGDAPLDDPSRQTFACLAARRAAGVPLAYLTGEREFRGVRLRVTPDVLVPRPETEGLVDWALACLAHAPAPRVVDLGTGSGAIALALAAAVREAPAAACPRAQPAAGAPIDNFAMGATAVDITATDASPAALAVARDNADRLGLPVRFVQGDWWQAVASAPRFGLAVANPPYVAGDDPHLRALADEPQAALTPGGDGLEALRRIVAGAPAHLLPGAWLLLEHGHDQADAVGTMLRTAGFEAVDCRADLAGLPRCSGGRWPGGTQRPQRTASTSA